MSDLLKTIHANEQMQAATRELCEGMTLEQLIEKTQEVQFKLKLLVAVRSSDTLFYSLAACKLMELIEQKEREVAGQ